MNQRKKRKKVKKEKGNEKKVLLKNQYRRHFKVSMREKELSDFNLCFSLKDF